MKITFVVTRVRDDQAPREETERRKDCCPPRRAWEQPRPNVAAKKNNHSLIDIEYFLRICQIIKQSANFVRFCESAWPAVLTMMRWGGMCLSDWFLACHRLSHTFHPGTLHHGSCHCNAQMRGRSFAIRSKWAAGLERKVMIVPLFPGWADKTTLQHLISFDKIQLQQLKFNCKWKCDLGGENAHIDAKNYFLCPDNDNLQEAYDKKCSTFFPTNYEVVCLNTLTTSALASQVLYLVTTA